MSAVAAQERLVEVPVGGGGEPAARQPAGEEKTFRPYDPEQVLLMAPVLSATRGAAAARAAPGAYPRGQAGAEPAGSSDANFCQRSRTLVGGERPANWHVLG